MPFQIVLNVSVIKKISAGQRFPTELSGVPGNILTGVVLLVKTTFLTLVTMFNVLLVAGTEMEWETR